MQLQEVKDAIISQIENLSNNQIESVWTYLQELTEAKNHQVDLLNQYLTFWCDKQLLGIRITKIVEVISMIEITPLPDFPPYMTGIISLRDNMIPVMDLRLRLGNTETPYNNHTCIVIVDIQGRSFGLIVDAVNDVERIPEASFSLLIQKSEQERIQKSERLDMLLAGERKSQQDIANIGQWARTIRQYLDLQELNREIIEELIDHIEIGERTIIDGQRHQDIKIYYRFVGLV